MQTANMWKFCCVVAAYTCGVFCGCTQDVQVHGIPEEIRLAAPFCVPDKPKAEQQPNADAGADAEEVADVAVPEGD